MSEISITTAAASATNKRRCKVCKKKKQLVEFPIYDVGAVQKRRHTCKACCAMAEIQRKCKTCRQIKPIAEFPFVKGASGSRRYHCRVCNSARVEAHHEQNMGARLARARAKYDPDAQREKLRDRAGESLDYAMSVLRRLVGYAGGCAACGENNPYFLTVSPIEFTERDYVRVPGYRESGSGLYLDIIRLGMPPELQILCFNCKFGRRRTGGTLVFDVRRDE